MMNTIRGNFGCPGTGKKIMALVGLLLTVPCVDAGDLVYWVAPPESGETVYDGSGTEADPFHHPQMAIDTGVAVRENPYDLITVKVKAGTYTFWPKAIPKIWDATYYWGNEYYALHITNSYVHVESVGGTAVTTLDGGYSNTIPYPGPAVPGKGTATGGGQMRNGHAIQIASGLSDVLVSGFSVTGGYQYNCNGNSPTTAVAASGTISNCLIKVYWRYQCEFIRLSGSALLCDSEVTSQSGGGASGNVGSNDADIEMSGNALVENCYIHDINKPTTSNYGGTYSTYFGVNMTSSGCVLRNCLIANIVNGHEKVSQALGGGIHADAGTIDNCTVVNCKAMGYGGGLYVGGNNVTVRNCIFWGNTATADSEGNDVHVASGKTPIITNTTFNAFKNVSASGNKTSDPKFAGGSGAAKYSIPEDSPCAGAGDVLDWMTATSKDLAGNARLWTDGTVSMGAFEAQGRSSSLSGDFVAVGNAFGRAPFTAQFRATPEGAKGECLYAWDFGDGSEVSYSSSAEVVHEYKQVGRFPVTLTIKDDRNEPVLIDKTVYAISVGTTCHVKTNSVGIPPYDTWERATSNLQAAVDLKPDVVLITNGTYAVDYSGDSIYGLKIYDGVQLKSVEGPDKTFIVSGYTKAPSAERRIITMTHEDAVLDGLSFGWGYYTSLEVSAGVVRNCVVSNFLGVYHHCCNFTGSSVVSNCVFTGSAEMTDGGSNTGRIVDVGGNARFERCELHHYKVTKNGCNAGRRSVIGVTGNGVVRNCYIHDNNVAVVLYDNVSFPVTNSTVYVEGGTVDNCTIINNTCRDNACGGLCVSGGKVHNCLVYGNTITAKKVPNDFYGEPGFAGEFQNNLLGVAVLPAVAQKCIVGEDPCFLSGTGYKFRSDSPCWNAGRNLDWCDRRGVAIDYDGCERHRNKPDIGCFEAQIDRGSMILLR